VGSVGYNDQTTSNQADLLTSQTGQESSQSGLSLKTLRTLRALPRADLSAVSSRKQWGNSGRGVAVAAWQLTEAASGRVSALFLVESTEEGAFWRSPQKQCRQHCYISIYQPPPPTTNTAHHPPTAIRPWVRLPFRSNTAGRPAILSRRVITAMSRPASASPAVLVARRPTGWPWHKTGEQGGWQE
jgi:hypothetical protein